MRIQPKDVWAGDAAGAHTRFDEVRRWMRSRELGGKTTLGHNNRLNRQLYSSITKIQSWNPMETANHQHHGGIFNFDFSKDGSVLVAACEKRSVLIFDPLNGQLISSKDKAHNDCVNCVRFLDSRLFATCSDDTTVCLWDVRYMKHKIRTLQAHSNWVKNIEYDAASGLLVTSGFDGSIFTWDINRYTESEESYKRVFHTPGLMRMKLTPDASKLVVATGSGYLMVIHDLDLGMLSQDLDNFMPNMYRWMQQTNTPFPQAYQQNYVFTQKRNRVELVSDFPSDNKADMIASLEVHPQGWCVVSRNTSTYEASEWTCVHDIQAPHSGGRDYQPPEQRPIPGINPGPHTSRQGMSGEHAPPGTLGPPVTGESQPATTQPSRTGSPAYVLSVSISESMVSPPSISQSNSATTATAAEDGETDDVVPVDLLSSSSVQFDLTQSVTRHDSSDDEDDSLDSAAHRAMTQRELRRLAFREHNMATDAQRQSSLDGHNSSSNSLHNVPNSSTAADVGRESIRRRCPHVDADRSRSPHADANRSRSPHADADRSRSPHTDADRSGSPHQSPHPSAVDVLPDLRIRSPSFSTFQQNLDRHQDSSYVRFLIVGHNKPPTANARQYIHYNWPRLTHYVEELNVGRGFIKEVSFSNDGRMICSPYGFGVRLLAFDADCSEMCDVVPKLPVKLYPVTSNMSHTSAVVTTKFSPLHCMFVSGCLNGKIDFHQPLL